MGQCQEYPRGVPSRPAPWFRPAHTVSRMPVERGDAYITHDRMAHDGTFSHYHEDPAAGFLQTPSASIANYDYHHKMVLHAVPSPPNKI